MRAIQIGENLRYSELEFIRKASSRDGTKKSSIIQILIKIVDLVQQIYYLLNLLVFIITREYEKKLFLSKLNVVQIG